MVQNNFAGGAWGGRLFRGGQKRGQALEGANFLVDLKSLCILKRRGVRGSGNMMLEGLTPDGEKFRVIIRPEKGGGCLQSFYPS